jgi:hypothetical protein
MNLKIEETKELSLAVAKEMEKKDGDIETILAGLHDRGSTENSRDNLPKDDK